MRLSTLLPVLGAASAVLAGKLTPESLLTAPRRSGALPNHDGSLVVYTLAQNSFETNNATTEIRVLDPKSHHDAVVTAPDGAQEPNWLDNETIVVLVPGRNGTTDVVVGEVADFDGTKSVAGNIDADASGVVVKKAGDGEYAFAVWALAKPDGSIYNPEKEPEPKSTGRLYKSTFVRHWDTYITPNRRAIWYGSLSAKSGSDDKTRSYHLSDLTNVLKGTGFESPLPPFGSTDNFDISSTHVVFVAKDLNLNPAFHTKSNVYIVDIDNDDGPGEPVQVSVRGIDGAATSPTISPDGKAVAFLQMRENGYESDKNQVIVVPDITDPSSAVDVFASADKKGRWSRSPVSVSFSRDGKKLRFLAEDRAHARLFSTSIEDLDDVRVPTFLAGKTGSVLSFTEVEDGTIIASGSSLVDNSIFWAVDPAGPTVKVLDSLSHNGALFGLSRDQISEIYFPGAEHEVHAWVIKPSFFERGKKYPLAYFIHGGPQSAWLDGWSTRWNPAVFAEQGFVVVAVNPTGSTGFGQDFTDAIKGQWGGLPYRDLVAGFEYVEKHLDFVDIDRAVGLGASYGGYMVNWIQGQPLGRRFKALVCHDGSFSIVGQLASEEQWFPSHDFGGNFTTKPDGWHQWDPVNFVSNWATPQLTIHSDKDFRLSIPDGLAAFTVLQSKGVESQFLEFPDENHWVTKPANSLAWHEAVINWINRFGGLEEYVPEEKFKGVIVEPQFRSGKGDDGEKDGRTAEVTSRQQPLTASA